MFTESDSAERECLTVPLPLVPRGAPLSAATARDETESVWLSLSPLSF